MHLTIGERRLFPYDTEDLRQEVDLARWQKNHHLVYEIKIFQHPLPGKDRTVTSTGMEPHNASKGRRLERPHDASPDWACQIEDQLTLSRLSNSLSPFQSEILYRLFWEEKTVDEVAREIGQTSREVRQIYAKAIRRLRWNYRTLSTNV